MRRLCVLSLLGPAVLGGCSVPGTEAGGPCNQHDVCVAGLTCDVVQHTCVSSEKIRWESVPTTVSVTLRAVWGISEDDLVAVGDQGTVIRYRTGDLQWHRDTDAMAKAKGKSLYAVWGRGNELWAAGSSVVLHFDGTSWSDELVHEGTTNLTSFTFRAVAGSATETWAVGDGSASSSSAPQVFKRASDRWLTVPDANLSDFSGRDLAVVDGSVVLVGSYAKQTPVFNGSTWTSTAIDTTQSQVSLKAVWGLKATDLWAAGSALFHTDGGPWQAIAGKDQPSSIDDIWGTANGDFYMVSETSYASDAYHCTATGSCFPVSVDETVHGFLGVWCSDTGSTVVVVGDDGLAFRRVTQ